MLHKMKLQFLFYRLIYAINRSKYSYLAAEILFPPSDDFFKKNFK